MLPSPPENRDGPSQKSREQQLNKACEACRLSKVRCLVNPAAKGSSQCLRCAKANRTCVFAAPQKRRQRKRTDVRVAELEREVRQMRAALKSSRISPAVPEDPPEVEEDDEEQDDTKEEDSEEWPHPLDDPMPPPSLPNKGKRPISPPSFSHDVGKVDPLDNPNGDIIDRGLISMEQAIELLDIYRNELVHDCPGISLSAAWSAGELREKKPVLFHAIMAAASLCKGSSLSNRLSEEVIYLFARSIIVKGGKSLEYIQALTVTVVYYSPPNTPAHLQVYQFGNMAASMALELGLASKPVTHEQLPKREIRSLQRVSSTEELLENCRTLLASYLLTAGLALRLRRPNILVYNSWMAECLSLLDKSPILTDRRLVAWIKLQKIADEAKTAFGFDDASTSFSLSELRLQVVLRAFERRMEDWKRSIPREVMNLSMTIEYLQNEMTMWEFGMDGGKHSAPEFRSRQLSLPHLDDDSVQPETLLSHSALQINSTIKCIGTAHTILDTFFQLPSGNMKRVSNMIYVRCIYALVVLLRADYAISADSEGLGTLLESDSLKVDYYLNTMIQKTTEAMGPQKCRVPSHWLFVLNAKVKSWHDRHQTKLKEQGKRAQERDSAPSQTVDLREHQASAGNVAETSSATQHISHMPASTDKGDIHAAGSDFSMNSATPNWPTSAAPLLNSDFGADFNMDQPLISDFSSAFQHGDLYFWNDGNIDTFGGWIPQGNMYSDTQYTPFNGDS